MRERPSVGALASPLLGERGRGEGLGRPRAISNAATPHPRAPLPQERGAKKKPGRSTGTAGLLSPHEGGLLLDRHQVDGGGLAAAVDLELELDPIALVEASESR